MQEQGSPKSLIRLATPKEGEDLMIMLQNINCNKSIDETRGQMRENMEEMQNLMTRIEHPAYFEDDEPFDENQFDMYEGMALDEFIHNEEQLMNETDEPHDEDSFSGNGDERNIPDERDEKK